MPPMVGPGLGAGEVATAACRTGLPLNLLGSVTTAAGAAATGFAADMLRTFARSSAFSFSILSSRAITSSSVADRAAPLNETRQSAAQAVPERSLFLMTFSPRSHPVHLLPAIAGCQPTQFIIVPWLPFCTAVPFAVAKTRSTGQPAHVSLPMAFRRARFFRRSRPEARPDKKQPSHLPLDGSAAAFFRN